jgi:CBS domain-containing protein
MSISRFVHSRVVGVSIGATLRDAAKAMRMARLSSLPVLRAGTVTGLITERDLVKAMALTDRPGESLVIHYVNDAVMAVPEDEVPAALAKMFAAGCTDMPVVEHGKLMGVVSARELLAAEAQLQGISV